MNQYLEGRGLAKRNIAGLYAIADTEVVGQSGFEIQEAVKLALIGGCHLIQYRDKTRDRQARLNQAYDLKNLCDQYQATFIVNDDIELAFEVQASGVHLGRDDGSLKKARNLLGQNKLIGISCYNDLQRAQAFVREGADYVAFGSFYPSQTKPHAVAASLDLIQKASQTLTIPVVAIGGINIHNATPLIEAGANALAIISDLFLDNDIESKAVAYQALFKPGAFQIRTRN